MDGCTVEKNIIPLVELLQISLGTPVEPVGVATNLGLTASGRYYL